MTQESFLLQCPPSHPLAQGLCEIVANLPQRFSEKDSDRRIIFNGDLASEGLQIESGAKEVVIRYCRPCDAFRALGLLLAGEENMQERSSFSSLGVMLDVSRNGVLRPSILKSLFGKMALMGINSVQLYMEDSYLLQGEPFFGYARGAYSPQELKQIDEDAACLGIEVIPCIQTLGHLGQILQWPAYNQLIDTKEVLMVGESRSYELIGKMLDTLACCFRSRRIHVGMDEAFGVGQGRYREQHGERPPFEVLTEHLHKVSELCKARGLEPMIWSDMYFRLGSATADYYDKAAEIPESVKSQIPDNVSLVYWDYYHTENDFYSEWITRHRCLGKEPIFAAGAWTWGRLWTLLPKAMATMRPGMEAARNEGVKEAFLTIWGDDGTECDPFSILPALQYFAELGYGLEPSLEQLQKRFFASCGGDFEGCLMGSGVDVIPGISVETDGYANYGKWILWHDPVLNFLDRHIPAALPLHYKTLAENLRARPRTVESAASMDFVTQLAKVLSLKSQIHCDAKRFYHEKNHQELGRFIESTLSEGISEIKVLWRLHGQIWHQWFKPFGWDVIERRYAGVVARLEHLQALLTHYLENPESRIEEFEYETQPLHPEENASKIYFNHARSSSASFYR